MAQNIEQKNILILGGSGFVSGILVNEAFAQQYNVWCITRGSAPMDARVNRLFADRNDSEAFEKAVCEAGVKWDAVFDCICMEPQHARQDISVFHNLTQQLIMISTDFVYEPDFLRFPQNEQSEYYEKDGYGGNKRLCELEFIKNGTGEINWTVLRTGHIYGAGSKLGYLPLHGRDGQLIEKMRAGQELELVGAGNFLHHPHYAPDLAKVMLSCIGNKKAYNEIFLTGGPSANKTGRYYEIIAEILGVPLKIKEVPVMEYQRKHPEHKEFLCNRIYDLSKMKKAGLHISSTPLEEGLRAHVESLL